ncbi:MAG: two-component system alkaline phosphatase synthesis response regulator PhoP [Bacteroidia bacterium]|jgi:two-component system alkaline phosphatase synthesis response regulator PhoP
MLLAENLVDMSAKVLIVDDEQDIVEFISYNLEKEGYRVYKAFNGTEAVKMAAEFEPDLIVLDVMMPGMDGIEACRLIRKNKKNRGAFIMFLTARNEEYTEIAGFEAGADDYITKPLKPRALVSRINAILSRRSLDEKEPLIVETSRITINPNSHVVTADGISFNLPRKEFDLLYLLASAPDKVFTREKILSKVWGDHVFVVDRTIDVHIRKIREKIGNQTIETVKGVGYKFVEL